MPAEPWVPVGDWWEPNVGLIVWVKEQCCFREWSDPYRGQIGEICGECNRDRPFDRVPNRVPSLNFLPDLCMDPFCNGERLRPLSCASAFAELVNKFCDLLAKRLEPDTNGEVLWERACSAYRALIAFKEHVPDWDPSGAYGGAFERWEEDCAREGLPAWGTAGRPEIVPLVESIRRERKEAITGARRAYEETLAPAERVMDEAIANAHRARAEAEETLFRNQREEIARWLSRPHKVDKRLLDEVKADQEAANREARARQPVPSKRWLAQRDDKPEGQPGSKKRAHKKGTAVFPEEVVALIHLGAAIRRTHEKAEAAAYRAYQKAVTRAQRAYERALAAPKSTRDSPTSEEVDWDTLIRLADRLTELDKRVDLAIGRFTVIDATASREEVIRHKEDRKVAVGLRKRPMPPLSVSGPRDLAKYAKVKELVATGIPAKQIARKTGVPVKTVYRWRKLL
jgi:hypothetical protein